MSLLPAASSETVSDEQLVGLARAGDEDAFLLLVARCMPMLNSLSRKYHSSQTESEDLVQEGLLALLTAVRTYGEGKRASFRTYAYTCARNRMISVWRRFGGIPETESMSDADERLAPNDTTDPALLLLRREHWELMHERLRALLSPVEYEVLMLYLGSYSYREIADRLRIGTKAVDNALQRLRRKLASSLAYTV